MSALENIEMGSDLAELGITCQPIDRQLLELLAHPWETAEDCASRLVGAAIDKDMADNGFSGTAKPLLRLVK
jgi:hypothetical protein